MMLYCSMKDWHRGCISHAEEVLKMLTKPAFRKPASFVRDTVWLEKVTEYFAYQLGAEYRLTKCMREGFAYHHGQMPQDLRELIEISIAKKTLQLVVCTKTLSEGINMPIKTAVLANITNPENETYKESLELRDLKNIVGRVGRAGKESYGLILLPTNGKNKEPIEKVVSVLMDNVKVERANGSLFYIVQKIIDKHLMTDEDINAFLESGGVAESIDTLINLNQEDVELEDINLDEVLEDSLAYYLGDEETKKVVKRVFNIRYSHLRHTLSGEEYGKFLQTGLPLADYNDFLKVLEGKTKDDFDINTPTDGNWIHFIMETIYGMNSVKRQITQLSKNKPLFPVHHDVPMTERIVTSWIAGKQYVEIAEDAGCNTEQAALYVDFIQRVIAVKSQSIVSYIEESFQIESTLMQLWPEMVKRGVSDGKALWLIDSGLGDRILVNIIADYGGRLFPYIENKEDFEDEIVHNNEVDEYIKNQPIPELLKERWKQYLRSKGMIYE